MKVDRIYKNAKVFTSNVNELNASAFAIKDGRFVFVGDNDGLKDYEGETIDLNGKFVIPGIVDSHAHIVICTANDFTPELVRIACDNKKECLDFIHNYINENPGRNHYKFMLPFFCLHGEKLTRFDLDEITTDAQIVIMEAVGHSGWVNSKVLKDFNISEDVEDISKNLSRYDRDENGRLTGFSTEAAFQPFCYGFTKDVTDEQIRSSLKRYIEFCVKNGISCVYEAGTPVIPEYHERVLQILCDMDKNGEVPITIESSYMMMDPRLFDNCIDVLKELDKKYNTEHVHCRIMKLMVDGILAGRSAAVVEPYDDGTSGGRITDEVTLSKLLVRLNEEGIDFHAHTVGDFAAKTVLDAVELAQKEVGDNWRINVTSAHLGLVQDEDINRYASLNVIADFTPLWHGGCALDGGNKAMIELVGEKRGTSTYRCGSIWNTGATVTFSSDSIAFFDFDGWSPFHGMENGILRKDIRLASDPNDYSTCEFVPKECECMTIEQMLLGYTINGAKQLRLEKTKGSIEVGKDADFVVLNENLLEINPEGMRNIIPAVVYYRGNKI